MQNFISLDLTEEERAKIKCNSTVLPGLLQGSMLVRRGSFERVGPFPEERKMGDFLDWYGRATLGNLNMLMLPETFVRREFTWPTFSARTSISEGRIARAERVLDCAGRRVRRPLAASGITPEERVSKS